jgi:hypothetical protein
MIRRSYRVPRLEHMGEFAGVYDYLHDREVRQVQSSYSIIARGG